MYVMKYNKHRYFNQIRDWKLSRDVNKFSFKSSLFRIFDAPFDIYGLYFAEGLPSEGGIAFLFPVRTPHRAPHSPTAYKQTVDLL